MKKIALFILSLLSILCFSVGCNNNHEHNFSIEWTKTDTHHYHICSCGEKQDYSQHTFDNGRVILTPTETTKGEKLFTCTVCEGTKIEKFSTTGTTPSEPSNPQNPTNPSNPHEHQYTKTIIDKKFLKSEATLSQKAVYFYSCECGAAGEKTFEYGDYAKPTSDVVYDISADNTYAEVVSYTGNSSSVVISDSFNDLPVTKIYDGAFESSSIESIIMPNSISSIGASAFKNCKNLQRIVLSENLIEIGNECFYYCSALTETTLPQSLVTIGSKAFIGCSLIEISIPGKITNIESHTFSFNKNLKEVDLPNNLLKIDSYAFYSCSKLENIQIPDSLKYIGSNVFESCGGLKYNTYERVNYLGNKNNPYLLAIGIEDNIYTSYQLHQNVKLIAPYTFQECGRLSKIIIPESVIYIGNAALYKCNALTDITVPFIGSDILGEESDKFYHIFGYNIPTTLKNIEIINAKTISRDAFYGCDTVENLTIPFVGESIDSETNSTLGYLFGAYSYGSVMDYIPQTLKSVVLTSANVIGARAFADCNSLTSITIPNSVTTIKGYAFSGCVSLTSITIPDSVVSISENAFNDCLFENVTIPTIAIESIPKNNLKSVTITSGESIPNNAFYDCRKLTSLTLPSSIVDIGYDAFYGCNNLSYNEYSNGKYLGIESNPYFALISIINKQSNLSINPQTKIIAGKAFSGSSADISFDENKEISRLNSYVFTGYNGTRLQIPDNILQINSFALYDCKYLTNLTIPFLGEKNNAYGYKSVFGYIFGYKTSKYSYSNIGETLQYPSFRDNATEYYHYYIPTSLKVVVLGGTSVSLQGFYNCSNLTNIELSNTITNISWDAFYNCSAEIDWGNNPSIKKIGTLAFNGYRGSSMNIPNSVTTIGGNAFMGCNKLKNITMSSSLTTIETCAFQACSSLETIIVPNSVISIGQSAFENCSALTNITLQNGLKTIGSSVFKGCTKLTNIVIPDTVTTIEQDAFQGCSNLTSITIGKEVNYIGHYAFQSCSKLSSVIFNDTSTWYVTTSSSDCKNKTGGTQTSVTNSSTNATFLKNSSNHKYYWYKV